MKKKTTRKKRAPTAGLRLVDAQILFARPSGATIAEAMKELGVSRATLDRYVQTLDASGHRFEIVGEREGRQVRRLVEKQGKHLVAFTLEELVWQRILARSTRVFEGTGIDDAIGRVSAKMLETLRPKERAKILDLDRRILDVPDHPYDYAGKSEVLDQIVSALLEEQPLVIKHESKNAERRQFRLDPYTLMTFRRALYVVGRSHHHEQIRTVSLTSIIDATRQVGEKFVYPANWDPEAYYAGCFGIIRGEETEVVVRFDASVEPWIRSRRWHPTQRLKRHGRFLYLKMRPHGTIELLTWILGWGSKAAVISPASLREEWARHANAMVAMAGELADAAKKRDDVFDDDDDEPT